MVRRWSLCVILSLVGLMVACSPLSRSTPMRIVLPPPTDAMTATPIALVAAAASPTPTRVTFSQLTLPPTFTPTFTATQTPLPLTDTATATSSATPTSTLSATLTPTLTSTPVPNATPTEFIHYDEPLYADIRYEDALQIVVFAPILFTPDDHLRTIYRRGQERSLHLDFLLSVGDCNSESVNYLEPLTRLDSTSETTPTVDDKLSRQTIELFSDSFLYKGQSVNSGLNSLSVMDPFWAHPGRCLSGETPLACDVRATHPFAALIMFGANDINVLTVAGYEASMRDIIEFLLERDIIPILSTFTVRPDVSDLRYQTAIRFNAVLVRLSEEYQIPLVNFWREAQSLPDRGILSDNAHLEMSGFKARNHLTVEMLNYLRTNIFDSSETTTLTEDAET